MIFVRRCTVALACCCLTLLHGMAVASPEGGNIVSGSGDINQDGKNTVVTQNTADIVVDWDSFNVATDESVHFQQSSTSDSALNRIYDANPSEIWGRISAVGNVWLLNPNGVFFSRTAKVSVGSLVAAGLWMDKDNFMERRYVLEDSRGIGDVGNAGVISASGAGVAMLGRQVYNSGSIRAHASKVTLASGEKIAVDFDGDGLLRFSTDSLVEQGMVSNDGSIEASEIMLTAEDARGVFGGVVNNGGVLLARKIDGSGGTVRLSAEAVSHSGMIDAAAIADAAGGSVQLEAGGSLDVNGAVIVAAIAGIDTEPTAMTGGSIQLLGLDIVVAEDTVLDASGSLGGGTILVGGDWQGNNPQVRNARTTTVHAGAQLRANAVEAGDGGTVVVWSDDTTRYAGHIEARGGAQGGDGGEAEVSGKENLQVRGFADLTAPNGKSGRLLLDPGTVRICDGPVTGCANDPAAPDAPLNTFTDAYIQDQLAMGNVEILTSAATDTNGMDEDIDVESGVSISWMSEHNLILTAGNDINLDGTLDAMGTGELRLNFGSMLSIGSASLSGTIIATGMDTGTQGISGPDVATTWTLTGDGAGSLSFDNAMATTTVTFSAIENLVGGSMRDEFTVNGAHTGDLSGGGGADEFTIGEDLTGSLDGGADGDTFNFDGGSVSDGVTGGAGGDTFDFNGGTVTGTVAGGAGTDVLDFAGINMALMITLDEMPDTDGFDGMVAGGAMVTFDGVDTITGGGGTDSLQGLDMMAATWTLGAADTYAANSQSLSFSNLENMDGGDGIDTFIVNDAHTGDLSGGGGADVFTITAALTGSLDGGDARDTFNLNNDGSVSMGIIGGGDNDTFNFNMGSTVSGGVTGGAGDDNFNFAGGTVMGTVAGGADTDVLNFSGISDALTIRLTGTPNADGFGGTITGGPAAMFSGINTITGGGGTDSLQGLDMAATWTLEDAIADTYVADSRTLSFSALENMDGGDEIDTFTVNGAHTGDLSGGGDADIFTITAALTGSLDGGDARDTFNLNNDGSVSMGITGGGDNDTFNFNMGSTVSGGVTGGAGDDNFNFAGGTVMGTVAGGADTDVLNFSGISDALTIRLTGTPNADGFGGTITGGPAAMFSGINTITGGGGTDSLQGLDMAATWTLEDAIADTYVADSRTLSFSALENLVGGDLDDTFTVNGAHTGDLSGGGGADVFTIGAALTGSLSGGDAVDTFNFDSGSVSGGVTGGAGGDSFDFNGGTVAGTVAGGADDDTLNFADVTADLTIALSSSGAPGGDGFGGTVMGGAEVTFSGINNIIGGDDTDSLQGLDAAATWTLGADDSYEYAGRTLEFSSIETMQGGGMGDTFSVDADSNSDHTIHGGGGTDIITYGGAVWNIDGTSITLGNNPVTQSVLTLDMMDVEILRGGANADTFTVAGASIYDIQGMDGIDTFILNAVLTGDISGGDADDVVRLGISGDIEGGRYDGGDGEMDVIAVETAGPNNWMVNGRTIAVRAASFTADNVEVLRGNTGVDTFTITANSNSDYRLEGGTGTGVDTVNDVVAYDGTVWNIAGDMVTLDTGGTASELTVSGIDILRGGNGIDMFTIAANSNSRYSLEGLGGNDILLYGGTAWNINGDSIMLGSGGNLSVLDIDSIETLHGGDSADTFTVDGASRYNIEGMDGGDTFILNEVLTGNISGGAANDVVQLGADGDIEGGSYDGGTGSMDVIEVLNTGANDWDVNGGTIDVGSARFTAVAVEVLRGNSGVDTFMIADSSDSDYTLQGRDGDDVVTYGGTEWAIDGSALELGSGSGSSDLTLNNIQILRGGDAADSFDVERRSNSDYTIDGGDSNDDVLTYGGTDWAIDGAAIVLGSGATSSDLTLTNLEILRGGGGTDIFTVASASSSSYTIQGEGSSDILSYRGTEWDIDGGSIMLGGGVGLSELNIDDIQVLRGSGGADTFTVQADSDSDYSLEGMGGDDIVTYGGTEWSVSGVNIILGDGGSESNLELNSIEILRGSAAADSFAIAADSNSDYRLEGGAADDIVTYGGTSWGINGAMLTLDNSLLTLDEIDILRGGASVDTFTVAANSDSDYMIEGGDNTDILSYSGTVWNINGDSIMLGSGGDRSDLNIDRVETLQGAGSADTFTVAGASSYNIEGMGGVDTFILNAVLTGNISGGGGDDVVQLGASGDIEGNYDGGDGSMDEIAVLTTGANNWDVNGRTIAVGTAASFTADNVEVLRGNSGVDTFAITANSNSDYRLEGGGDDDIVTYGGTSWGINGAVLTLGDSMLTLDEVEILQGGATADTFTVSSRSNSDYTIRGLGGDDVITYGGTSWGINGAMLTLDDSELNLDMRDVEILRGGTSVDTFTVAADSDSDYRIDGEGGTDILIYDGTAWNIRGGSIMLGSGGDRSELNINGVETLRGSTAADSFNIESTSNSDYTIQGQAGDDTITYGGTSWMISGNMVDLDDSRLNLQQVETLQGGAMADTFTVNAATGLNLFAGDGADMFIISAGSVSGDIDGEGGSDTLDMSAIAGMIEVSLGGTPDADGFDGMVRRGVSLDFDGIDVLFGGAASTDILTVLDSSSDWVLDTISSYTTAGEQLMFSGLENISAGSMRDIFMVNSMYAGSIDSGGGDDEFTVSAQITGSISGGAGDDVITVEATGSVDMGIDAGTGGDTVTVRGTVSDGIDTGAGGDMVTVDGGTVNAGIDLGGDSDTIVISSGTINGGIDGGSGDDTFDIDGGTIMGTLAGAGGGNDYIDLSGISTGMQLTVSGMPVASANDNGFSGEIAGGFELTRFTGINRISGGSMVDDMTVSGSGGSYTIVDGGGNFDSYDVGGRILMFDSWENIQAGSLVDSFTISGDHSGDIMTGAGDDVVTLSARLTGRLLTESGTDTVTVNASGVISNGLDTAAGADTVTVNAGGMISNGLDTAAGADTITISGGTVEGGIVSGADGDTLNINSGSVMGNIDTGNDDDEITISGNAMVSEDVNTGIGDDELTISDTARIDRNVILDAGEDTLTAMGGTIGGNIEAGGDDDVVTVSGGVVTGSIDLGSGDDTYTISSGSVGMGVTGGDDDDVFNIMGGTTSGTVAGGDDDDTLSFASITDALTATLNVAGASGFSGDVTDGGTLAIGFTGIDTIVGGTTTDLLNGLVITAGTYNLQAGMDSYDVGGGMVLSFDSWENIQAGTSDDTFIVTGAHTGNLMDDGGSNIFTIRAELDGSITGGDVAAPGMTDTVTIDGGSVTRGIDLRAGDDVVVVRTGGVGGGIVLGAGADSITVESGGEVTGGIDMGAGIDMLTLNGGRIVGRVDGGADSDTFDINAVDASGSYDIAGGGALDILDFAGISVPLTIVLDMADTTNGFGGSVNGRAGASFGTGMAFSGINEIVGGSSTDLLTGINSDGVWTLAAMDTYRSRSVDLIFSELEDIQGGSAVDMFTVSAMHTGNLMGGDGADSFTIMSVLTGAVAGEGGGDMIMVVDNGVVTSGVSGGAGDDTVSISGTGNIQMGVTGGAGSDTFDIDGGTISGTLDGGSDNDILDMSDIVGNLETTLTGVGGNGFAGNVRNGYMLSFDGIDDLRAGSGENQITGLNSDGTWALAAASSSYETGGQTLNLSAITNFFGGSGADTYNINAARTSNIDSGAGSDTINVGAALTGDLNTGSGSDTITVDAMLAGTIDGSGGTFLTVNNVVTGMINLGADGSFVIVNAAGSIESGLVIAGGDNRVEVNGGSVRGGISVAPARENALDMLTLTITGGSINGDIRGGGGSDNFILSGGTLSGGSIIGRTGRNNLDLSSNSANAEFRMSDVNINGFSGDLTLTDAVAGTEIYSVMFMDINLLAAGSGIDTFFGLDRDATWDIRTSAGSYSVDGVTNGDIVISSAIENYVGGSAVDRFTLNGGHEGNIAGGGGNDQFTISGIHTGNIEGGAGDDSFDINAVVTGGIYGDSSADTAVTGDDSFTLAADVSATVIIDGGMGTDTFTAPDVEVPFARYTLTGVGAGSYSYGSLTQSFAGIENINAGDNTDVVTIEDGAGLAGRFAGGGGENVLDFSAYTTTVEATVLDEGSVDGGVGFNIAVTPFTGGADNINSFTGGTAGDDAFRGIEGDPNVVGQFGANFVVIDGMVIEIDGGAYTAIDNTNPDRFAGRSIEYQGVEIIAGGSAEDMFNLEDMGLISGGLGLDSLDFLESANAGVDIVLTGVDEDRGYSGTVGTGLMFEGIDIILGSLFSDSITGLDAGGVFMVDGVDAGGYTGITASGELAGIQLVYQDIEAVAGGAGNDIFSFGLGGIQSGGIDGGMGVDTMDFSQVHVPLTFLLEVNADGARGRVHTESADGVLETFVGRFETTRPLPDSLPVPGGAVSLPDAYWTNIDKVVGAAPDASVEGEASGRSFFVVRPETPDTDLIINREKTEQDDSDAVAVTLPDLSDFEGYLFLGGSGITSAAENEGDEMGIGGVPFPLSGLPPGDDGTVAPLPLAIPMDDGDDGDDGDMMGDSAPEPDIRARRLVIGGDVAHRGSVVVLGSTIVLEQELAAGVEVPTGGGGGMTTAPTAPEYNLESAAGSDYSVVIIATGMSETDEDFGADENGYIIPVMAVGERERRIYSGEAVIAADFSVQNAFSLRVDLGAGDLQFAQGLSNFILFNPGSNFVGRSLTPAVRTYLTVDLNLDIVEFILSVFNPASGLAQTASFLLDQGLFEEDLSLFSTIARGIAMYLSLCEELEGCAPPVGLDVLDQLIAGAEERLITVQVEYSKADADELSDLQDLLYHYTRTVRDMRKVKQEWITLFAPELLGQQQAAEAEPIPEVEVIAEDARLPDRAAAPAVSPSPQSTPPATARDSASPAAGGTQQPGQELPPSALRGMEWISPEVLNQSTRTNKSYKRIIRTGKPQIKAATDTTAPVVSQHLIQ